MADKYDTSIDYLYSPFRSKESNPKDWDYKMNYWKNRLNQIFDNEKNIIFDWDRIKEKIVYKNRPPSGLNIVLNELIKQKILFPLESYQQMPSQGQGWIDWGTQIIKYPVTYVNQYVTIPFFGDTQTLSECGKYVNKKNLENVSNKFYKLSEHHLLSKTSNRIFSLDQILDSITDSTLKSIFQSSPESLYLVLNYLEQKKLITFESNQSLNLSSITSDKFDYKHIFINFTNANVTHKDDQIDPEMDVNLIRLKRVEKVLESDIQKLLIDIDKSLINAREYLRQRDINKAKLYLKRKLTFEKQLRNKEISQDNIRNLMDQITSLHSNKLIYNAYKSGVSAYKNAVERANLSTEDLDATMDEMQEVFDIQKEIDNVLSGGQQDTSYNAIPSMGLSSDEMLDIENELETLLKEQQKQVEGQTPLIQEPSTLKNNKVETPDSVKEPQKVSNLYPTLPTLTSPVMVGSGNIKSATPRIDDINKAYQALLLDDNLLNNMLPDIPNEEPKSTEENITKSKKPAHA